MTNEGEEQECEYEKNTWILKLLIIVISLTKKNIISSGMMNNFTKGNVQLKQQQQQQQHNSKKVILFLRIFNYFLLRLCNIAILCMCRESC